MKDRRRLAPIAFVLGVFALTMAMRSPRFESLHTTDVLVILGSGMWFGVGLMALFLRPKPPA